MAKKKSLNKTTRKKADTFVLVTITTDGRRRVRKTVDGKELSREDADTLATALAETGKFRSIVIGTSGGTKVADVPIPDSSSESTSETEPANTDETTQEPAKAPQPKVETVALFEVEEGTLVRVPENDKLFFVGPMGKLRGKKGFTFVTVNETTGERIEGNSVLPRDKQVLAVSAADREALEALWKATDAATTAKATKSKKGPGKRELQAAAIKKFLEERAEKGTGRVFISMGEIEALHKAGSIPGWACKHNYRFWKVAPETDGEVSMGGAALTEQGYTASVFRKEGLYLFKSGTRETCIAQIREEAKEQRAQLREALDKAFAEYAEANAKDAVKIVKAATEIKLIERITKAEITRDGGPRTSVTTALGQAAQRLAA